MIKNVDSLSNLKKNFNLNYVQNYCDKKTKRVRMYNKLITYKKY